MTSSIILVLEKSDGENRSLYLGPLVVPSCIKAGHSLFLRSDVTLSAPCPSRLSARGDMMLHPPALLFAHFRLKLLTARELCMVCVVNAFMWSTLMSKRRMYQGRCARAVMTVVYVYYFINICASKIFLAHAFFKIYFPPFQTSRIHS